MKEYLKEQNTFVLRDSGLWEDSINGFYIEPLGDNFMLFKWEPFDNISVFLRYLRSPFDLERVYFAIMDEKIR